jgi:ubiquitin carboxyl-terminal hydrolase 36/42
MNDEMVTHAVTPPVSLKSAYVLFYIREKGQALEAALKTKPTTHLLVPPKVHLAMKKRKVVESEEEDLGVSVTAVPLSPSSLHSSSPAPTHHVTPDFRRLKTDHISSPDESKTVLKNWTPVPSSPTFNASVQSNCDPQADALKKKIEALTKPAAAALDDLTQYASSEDEKVQELEPVATSPTKSSSPVPPPQTPSPMTNLGPISETAFYGPSKSETAGKMLKSPSKWARGSNPSPRRRPHRSPNHYSPLRSFKGTSPFNRLAGSHDLYHNPPRVINTYGKKKRLNLEQRVCN